MTPRNQIQFLLSSHGVRPKKHLGQNFLVDKKDLVSIADAVEIDPGDTVVEVGSGTGNLTKELIAQGARVVAIEKDERLAKILKAEVPKAEVLNRDILRIQDNNLPQKYKLAGNVPYYLTRELIRKFLTSSRHPELMVLTVQKEVGETIVASPPQAKFLSMMIRVYGDAKIVRKIPAEHFWPSPKVDSVVLKIHTKKTPEKDTEQLVRFVKRGFSHPRKTILNNLSKALVVDKSNLAKQLDELKIDPKTRPGELNLDDWKKILRAINY